MPNDDPYGPGKNPLPEMTKEQVSLLSLADQKVYFQIYGNYGSTTIVTKPK